MATAISTANFQAACGEVYDALASKDWENAWLWYARAEAQHSGLEASASDGGGAALSRRQNLNGLRDALVAAQGAVERQASRSRFVRTRLRHTT